MKTGPPPTGAGTSWESRTPWPVPHNHHSLCDLGTPAALPCLRATTWAGRTHVYNRAQSCSIKMILCPEEEIRIATFLLLCTQREEREVATHCAPGTLAAACALLKFKLLRMRTAGSPLRARQTNLQVEKSFL